MRNRWFSIFFIDRHLFSVGRMSADGCIDGSFIVLYNAIYNTAVFAVNTMRFDLFCNFNVAFIIFSYSLLRYGKLDICEC